MEKKMDGVEEMDGRKAYSSPEIIYESDLETRAGSPLGLPDPLELGGE